MPRRSLLVFAVALIVRLLHVWQMRRSPFFTVLMGDSRAYDEWAQRIAGGDWIGHDVFYQAPLYPYFLGVIYAVAGRHLLLVRIVQAVLGSLACVFVALAGRNFFSERAGFAAGLVLALYAPAIFFDGLIQKSVLDVFLLSAVLWSISTRSWLWLGIAIGALALTRENAIVFIVVIALWALVTPGPKGRGLRASDVARSDAGDRDAGRAGPCGPAAMTRLRRTAIFMLGVAIVVAPVAIRNSIVGGGFYVTTSQFGPNFYIGNNPRSDGTYQPLRFGRGSPEYERQDATEIAGRALGRRLTPAEVSSYWTDRAIDFVTGRPVDWMRLMARKAALLVNATEMLDTESQESHAEWSLPLRVTAIAGHFGVVVPLAIFGMIAAWPTRARWRILIVMLVAYAASVVMFYVFARYRYPLVPMLVLFAGVGIVKIFDVARVGLQPDRARIATIASVAAAAVIANWPMLSKDQMRAITEHNLGAALQDNGRYDEALVHYQRALALDPGYAPAYNNMASTLRAKGQVREAVDTYRQALRLQPDYPEAHYNIANALVEEGKSDEAVDHFERALQSISGSADVHNNLAIALANRGRYDEAAAEFREALRLDPDSAKAHRNLGDTLATLGARDAAIDHLRRASELDPSDASTFYDLGSTLLEAGKPDEAVTAFRAALKLTPGSVEAHNNLGIALGSQGKIDEAIAEFRTALKIKPDFAEARRNLATAEALKQTRK